MIRIQTISALFIKQIKDVLKNMPVLVLFIIYPVIALVMTQAMKQQISFFLSIFATMHCVFTPIVATASVIAEEKENNTLRVLIMSNVTLREYLLSIGGFILLADLLTGSAFLFMADKATTASLYFLAAMATGCFISVILGASIGLYADNAAAANGIAVPFGMVFAFLPMLSFFNKGLEKVSRFVYGQQISYLLSGEKASLFGCSMIAVNLILLAAASAILYRKSLSEE